jgi:hypothetical protein
MKLTLLIADSDAELCKVCRMRWSNPQRKTGSGPPDPQT